MTDAQMVIVPRVATEEMADAVIEAINNPENCPKEGAPKQAAIQPILDAIASPNQGKVTPEMVEAIAKRICGITGLSTKDHYIDDAILVVQNDLRLEVADG
ncbi:hypothetical protein [Kiloniella litopenaei]|uniref:hypothetical protein n=1 Tax=Kiloniella litopenaei TaxID=1549748 RepID=UPI003BAB3693